MPVPLGRHAALILALASSWVATATHAQPPAAAANEPKPATAATKAANAALHNTLPFGDRTAFELAHKGFIAPLPGTVLKSESGTVIWDPGKYAFIKEGEPAPETVNPSLWRQSQLLNISGLFQVADGIYQIRNQDLSNMTIVEGQKGIAIFDPLVSAETAKAALVCITSTGRASRWSPSSIRTATSTTTAACAAW